MRVFVNCATPVAMPHEGFVEIFRPTHAPAYRMTGIVYVIEEQGIMGLRYVCGCACVHKIPILVYTG